ncbi:hypothetical protein ACT3TH_01355 [Psychrobacter sp. AOP22-C1-C5]|uniref:hypothetical protein n=1 Tax=Psychrobacter sp. AOP22-C1-C5 TaxID=3457716 RepID=UPI004036A828
MKKNIYRLVLPILFIAMAGCSNAEDINSPVISKTHEGDVSLTQTQTLETPQSKLNCAQFNLDSIDNMVCTYWKDSKKFKETIKIQDYETYSSLIEVQELSPVEYNFFATTEVYYKNEKYKAKVFPNSRVELSDGNEILNLICNKGSCSKPFLWGFATESTIKVNPELANVMMNKLSYIYNYNYKKYLRDKNSQVVRNKIAVKVYFNNPHLDDTSYVIRFVDQASPLKNAIQEYLNGLTIEEKNLGFESNNFGNNNFTVKIVDNIAKIHFTANDLIADLQSPQQVINFSHSIRMTAEQFNTVDATEICINNSYNYQMAFLANEESVDCPF